MTKFIASLIQLNSQDNISDNLAAVEKYLYESADNGADLVLLPENTFFMQEPGGQLSPNYDEAIIRCSTLAKERRLWVLIGSVKVTADNGKFYNRSLLVNDAGEVVAQYDKIHLFDVMLKGGETYNESAKIMGGKEAVLAKMPWGNLGMTVCYDVRFPYLYRELAHRGADFLSVPSAFTYTTGTAHWHSLLKARAIENGCYVFAPAQCGVHPGNRRTYGHSLVVSPWGEIICEASENKPGITIVQIDVDKVYEARTMLPSLRHDKEFGIRIYPDE